MPVAGPPPPPPPGGMTITGNVMNINPPPAVNTPVPTGSQVVAIDPGGNYIAAPVVTDGAGAFTINVPAASLPVNNITISSTVGGNYYNHTDANGAPAGPLNLVAGTNVGGVLVPVPGGGPPPGAGVITGTVMNVNAAGAPVAPVIGAPVVALDAAGHNIVAPVNTVAGGAFTINIPIAALPINNITVSCTDPATGNPYNHTDAHGNPAGPIHLTAAAPGVVGVLVPVPGGPGGGTGTITGRVVTPAGEGLNGVNVTYAGQAAVTADDPAAGGAADPSGYFQIAGIPLQAAARPLRVNGAAIGFNTVNQNHVVNAAAPVNVPDIVLTRPNAPHYTVNGPPAPALGTGININVQTNAAPNHCRFYNHANNRVRIVQGTATLQTIPIPPGTFANGSHTFNFNFIFNPVGLVVGGFIYRVDLDAR